MELETYFRFGLALVFVLALVGLVGLLMRRFGGGAVPMRRGRQRRLAVVEMAPIDARRRLVLVRRDDVEHLLLLGSTQDLVVESRIRAEGQAFQQVLEGPRDPAGPAAGGDPPR